MTWLPRSPDSTLVLRLNQETVHEFILLFMPPCSPHLTPQATRSLERSLLVFSTPRGLTGDDLLLMVYFGTPNMLITLWFGFVYGTNPPQGTLII
jgi:hypothetical protein